MLIPLTYVAIFIPFFVFYTDGDPSSGWAAVEYVITALFAMDMAVNFSLAYHDDDGVLITSRCTHNVVWLHTCLCA